jgi:hypothetical protein
MYGMVWLSVGAKLMLVVNNVAGPATTMGSDSSGPFTISAGMITLQDWNFINASATQSGQPIR